DLVVHLHDRDQQDPVVQLSRQQLEIEPAVGPNRKHRQVDAAARQPLAGVEHRRMLGRYGDDPGAGVLALGGGLLDAALERPVDRLGCAAGERDAAALEADRLVDLLARDLDRRFGFVAPARWRMRVREPLLDPRLHCLDDFGRERRRRLVIEVDHAALAADRRAIRCHSSRKRSTSASTVCGPKLMRRKPLAISVGTAIAASTALCFIAPDEQALPAETAIPARSNCTSKEALAAPGSDTAPIVGIRGLDSPITTPPDCLTPRSRRARSMTSRSRS